ncbi:RCC1 domain-containing protein 1-like isoform X1 [Mya arenaria]|uniref:RCC1 domain-containing protein 1-like isoform X1 n=2 Tax=Mya arenaria TaxID=6604 RepID=UPI0022E27945|nr:RCC1 domain-containing protein 1-like isoform X1 [Mya arenaria]
MYAFRFTQSSFTIKMCDISNREPHLYVCGNNSCGQLSGLTKDVDVNEDDSTMPLGLTCLTSVAVNIFPAPLVFTWSQVVGVKDNGSLCFYGYNSCKMAANIEAKVKDNVTSIVECGNCVLVQSKGGIVLMTDDGKYTEIENPDDVTIFGATSNAFYGVKDGECYKASLNKAGEEPSLTFSSINPDPTPGLSTPRLTVLSLACGVEHTLFLTDGGRLFSSGTSSRGQLGHGCVTVDLVSVPMEISTLEGIQVVAIATGSWHSAAATAEGDIYMWGWNESGQLGLPTSPNSDRPVNDECLYQDVGHVQIQPEPFGLDLPDDYHVTMVTCGSRHSCLLTAAGEVFVTGWNKCGQLGLGDTKSRDCFTHVYVENITKGRVKSIHAQGWNTSIAVET